MNKFTCDVIVFCVIVSLWVFLCANTGGTTEYLIHPLTKMNMISTGFLSYLAGIFMTYCHVFSLNFIQIVWMVGMWQVLWGRHECQNLRRTRNWKVKFPQASPDNAKGVWGNVTWCLVKISIYRSVSSVSHDNSNIFSKPGSFPESLKAGRVTSWLSVLTSNCYSCD